MNEYLRMTVDFMSWGLIFMNVKGCLWRTIVVKGWQYVSMNLKDFKGCQ